MVCVCMRSSNWGLQRSATGQFAISKSDGRSTVSSGSGYCQLNADVWARDTTPLTGQSIIIFWVNNELIF
jgi:hypothetical protein